MSTGPSVLVEPPSAASRAGQRLKLGGDGALQHDGSSRGCERRALAAIGLSQDRARYNANTARDANIARKPQHRKLDAAKDISFSPALAWGGCTRMPRYCRPVARGGCSRRRTP